MRAWQVGGRMFVGLQYRDWLEIKELIKVTSVWYQICSLECDMEPNEPQT